jgi:hypothetical protein
VFDWRIHSNSFVTEDLTNKIVAWASEVAGYAAQPPSRQARDDYLRERRRELVTGAARYPNVSGVAALRLGLFRNEGRFPPLRLHPPVRVTGLARLPSGLHCCSERGDQSWVPSVARFSLQGSPANPDDL